MAEQQARVCTICTFSPCNADCPGDTLWFPQYKYDDRWVLICRKHSNPKIKCRARGVFYFEADDNGSYWQLKQPHTCQQQQRRPRVEQPEVEPLVEPVVEPLEVPEEPVVDPVAEQVEDPVVEPREDDGEGREAVQGDGVMEGICKRLDWLVQSNDNLWFNNDIILAQMKELMDMNVKLVKEIEELKGKKRKRNDREEVDEEEEVAEEEEVEEEGVEVREVEGEEEEEEENPVKRARWEKAGRWQRKPGRKSLPHPPGAPSRPPQRINKRWNPAYGEWRKNWYLPWQEAGCPTEDWPPLSPRY